MAELNDESLLNARPNFVLTPLRLASPHKAMKIRTAGDMGRDRGRFTSSSIVNKCVFDVSNKRATENVTRLTNLQDAIAACPDLVKEREMLVVKSRRLRGALNNRRAILQESRKSPNLLLPISPSEHNNFSAKAGLHNLATDAELQVLLLDTVDVRPTLFQDGRIQFSSSLCLLAKSETK
jgi:hypothetical protein